MILTKEERDLIKKAFYETFIEKLYECNHHKKRIILAKKKLNKIMTLTFHK